MNIYLLKKRKLIDVQPQLNELNEQKIPHCSTMLLNYLNLKVHFRKYWQKKKYN
jgi:hypothetical protein